MCRLCLVACAINLAAPLAAAPVHRPSLTLLSARRAEHKDSQAIAAEAPHDASYIYQTNRNWYYLERTTLEQEIDSSGKSIEGGDLCLAVGLPDQLDGVSLTWKSCLASNIATLTQIYAPDQYTEQQFQLTLTGSLMSRKNGLCVRRMTCSHREIYDLGDCDDEDFVVKFEVQKAVANNLDHLKSLGYPIQAVAGEFCELCGPYLMLDQCTGSVNVPERCDRNWEAKPGWTKLPSQYVGDDPEQEVRRIETIGHRATSYIRPKATLKDTDATSFGPASQDISTCGSDTGVFPAFAALFYLVLETEPEKYR